MIHPRLNRKKLKLINQLIIISFCHLYCNLLVSQQLIDLQLVKPAIITLKKFNLWNCIIRNNSNIIQSVYLQGQIIERKNGKMYEVKSGNFNLSTGVTMYNTTNYSDLKGEVVLVSSKGFEDYVVRTNNLPNGDYTFCVTMYEVKTNRKLAENCMQNLVQIVTPPSLISPGQRTVICEDLPIFIWERYRGAINSSNIRYKIKLVEILKNQNEVQAIRANPCFYCESNLSNPPVQYSFKNISLQDEKSYAWYIGVLDGNREIAQSQIWQFTKRKCTQGINVDVTSLGFDDEEEQDEEIEPENKPIKGRSYYFIANYAQESNKVVLKSDELNFYIDNLGESQNLKYTLMSGNEIIKSESYALNVSKNYFSIDVKGILSVNKQYQLKVLYDNGEQGSLIIQKI
jgi:hypothetical protein